MYIVLDTKNFLLLYIFCARINQEKITPTTHDNPANQKEININFNRISLVKVKVVVVLFVVV